MSSEQQIRQVLERVTQEVARLVADEREQAARASDEARQQADRQIAELKTQVAETRQQAEAQVADLRRQSEAQVTEARKQADAHVAEARRLADAHVAEARKQGEAQAVEIRRQAEMQLAQLRDNAQRQVDELRRTAESQVAEVKRLAEAEIESARRSANADAEDLVISQLAAAAVDNDVRTKAEVDRVQAEAGAEAAAQARRLSDSVQALDQARSLGELLDYLAQCAGQEVERAAVLLRRGDRLEGWRLVGFGTQAPAAKSIDLDFDAAGIAGEAAVAATAVLEGEPPSFARDAATRVAQAVPVIVGGDVVAVLYADTSSVAQPAGRWRPVLDVLARHVSRALEAMTVRQAAGLSLPRPMARASQPAESRLTAGQESGHIQ